MVDFTKTKPVIAAPKTAAKPEKIIIKFPGVADLARVDVVQKAAKGACETLSGELKKDANQIFIGQGIQFGRRPENLNAVDGKATGSIQLKVNPSALTEDAIAKLNEAKIPLKTVDQVVETYRFNEKYVNDEALLAKIKEALDGIEGVPDDLIEFQSQKKIVCDGDRTIDAIFRLRSKGVPDRAKIETLLPLVTQLAIKVQTTESLEECLDATEELLLVKEQEDDEA